MEQIVLFDYMGLDTETRIIVQQEDKEFDQNMESAGRSFVFACRNLQRIHKTLLYTRPGFVEYIAAKPGMSKSTAYKMLNVAEMFPHYGNISAAPSALYLLASPSTPEPARLEAIERAEAGEVITHKTAKEIVTEYQRKEFQDAQDERRFAKELFGPEPVLVHGPIGNYTQEGSLKRCEKCHQLWAADLNYCPYCNISPDARALHLQNERLRSPMLDKEILNAAKQIRQERGAIRKEERVERINEIALGNQPLSGSMDRLFPVVYADPPWRYEHSQTTNREIENHYPTMTLEEICALPVGDIVTPDSILFLWTTSPKLEESMRVIAAWGFTYRTCLVWVKDKIGMGYYARQRHELLLVAKRGSIPVPDTDARFDSVIECPRVEHSKKPDVVYEMIDKMYPHFDKVELFARQTTDGWYTWGNQS